MEREEEEEEEERRGSRVETPLAREKHEGASCETCNMGSCIVDGIY